MDCRWPLLGRLVGRPVEGRVEGRSDGQGGSPAGRAFLRAAVMLSSHASEHRALQPEPEVPGDLQGDRRGWPGSGEVVYVLDEVPHGTALGSYVAGKSGKIAAGYAAQDEEIVEGVQVAASAGSSACIPSPDSFTMHMGPKPLALEAGFFRARWHLRHRTSAFSSHSSDMPGSSELPAASPRGASQLSSISLCSSFTPPALAGASRGTWSSSVPIRCRASHRADTLLPGSGKCLMLPAAVRSCFWVSPLYLLNLPQSAACLSRLISTVLCHAGQAGLRRPF